MLIRELRADDAAARVAVTVVCIPYALITEDLVRKGLADPDRPPSRLSLVAEIDGRVVGAGNTSIDSRALSGVAAVQYVEVLPEFRGRGIGSALHERLTAHEERFGVRSVSSSVTTTEGRAFAERRGFVAGTVARILAVDTGKVPPVPPLPDGITLRTLAEVEELRPLFELNNAVSKDIPRDRPYEPWTWEQWNEVAMKGPALDWNSSMVAYEGEQPVAVTFLNSAPPRAFNSTTGTLASHRGRGLAKLVKAESLRRAAERGVTTAFTNNDERNAPMLAVNTWLGYTFFCEQRAMVREV